MVWRLVLLDISPLCVFAPLRALRETRQKFKALRWFKGLIVVQKVQEGVEDFQPLQKVGSIFQ